MAIISKIRSYSGLLIAIVGFGLAAFVLGDLFQYGGPRRGPQHTREIASINNNPISLQEFDERYNQHLESWKQQTGITSPDRQQEFRIRQQAYDDIVKEILLQEELEKTGIDVSSEELFELVAGSDPHPFIVQSFTDPQTGQFDAAQVRNFIQNIHHMDPQTRNQWLMLEQYIKKERKETKYMNLVRSSIYIPDMLAEVDHKNKNTSVDIRFIAKNYNTIPDKEVEISESDVIRAYNENKHKFHQDHTIDFDYVVVNVNPTEEDRRKVKEDILDLKAELQAEQDVERFINIVSDERFDRQYHSRGELSPEIDSVMFNSPVGTIYGPYEQNDAFVVAMLNDIQFRPDSMRASHILIAYRGSMADRQQQLSRNFSQAEQKADSLLDVVRRNPARFPQLATEFSDDPSAAMNMGDLEWFSDGNMVPEFNEAVVTGNVGDIVKVETDFGFHIINITGHSTPVRKVQVAKLVRNIEPSSQTYRRIRADVSQFAAEARQKKDLESAAKDKGYAVRQATHVGKMDNSIPGVREARDVIRWAYNEDVREGQISQVYNFDDMFVLAKVSKIRKEGTPKLEDIRNDIEPIAIKDKKFQMISQKLQEAVSLDNSLEKAAEHLDIELHSANNVNLLTRNLPGFGREPKVIGKALALEVNKISHPVKGNNSVFVVEVVDKSVSVAPDDLTTTKRQLQNNLKNRAAREVVDALKKNADIKDNRTFFF